jgi:hypothetical protein
MRRLLAALLALLIAVPAAYAQERKTYGQAELDQMLAPVALYPDDLLSQVLMASTYPLEVVEAARWSRAHPGIQGDEAVRAAADKDWDPSVKSLLAFPNVLARMDENLDWTRRLGDAFLAQETQVMDTVQQLRQRAQAAGNLAPDERQRVVADGRTIVIEAADPRVVYVPYYDPYVAYGPWWWSAYPPVVWAPWPGYAVGRPGLWWGVGVGITAGFFFGGVDWHHRHVRVLHANNYYVRPPVVRRGVIAHRPMAPGRWEHNPSHRRGIAYRSPEVHKRFAATVPQREFRREPRPAASAPTERRFERPDRTQWPRQEPRREERRDDRRDDRQHDRRGQIMPPAFTASSPPPRFEARQERRREARLEHQPQPKAAAPQRPQPRIEAPQRSQPRVEAPQRSQPRIEAPQRSQPRIEAPHRAQPGFEARPPQRIETHRQQPRIETRGGDRGGWREHAGRGNGRG